nr:hypothetical protein [Tanacetum cinerariifolium]
MGCALRKSTICSNPLLFADAFTSAKDMWKRVERLMRGTIQSKVDRETRFTNEFDQFVAEPGEALVFEDIQNNSEEPLASTMLLLARAITQNFSNPTNNCIFTSSNTKNQAIIQGDIVNFQSRNSGNTGRNNRRAYVQEEVVEDLMRPEIKGHYARNYPKPRVRDSKYFMEQMLLAKQDEAGVIFTDEQNEFLYADASRLEEIEDLSANICLIARIQPTNNPSDAGPSYDSAFISEHLKHGLEYSNPYTLKQAISQCLKLYLASTLGNLEIPLNVRDTEDTLDDASKSQQK